MSWAVGEDEELGRDIGYGIPSFCEHPDCNEVIDRGMGCACGGEHGNHRGCNRYFCERHLYYAWGGEGVDATVDLLAGQLCAMCVNDGPGRFPTKPDMLAWTYFKMTDPSWHRWRLSVGLRKWRKNRALEKVIELLEGYGGD
jgi:hypothetical protein